MPDDLFRKRMDKKMQLIGDQLREALQAGSTLECREACNRIVDQASNVQVGFTHILVQLQVLVQETGQTELYERLRRIYRDVNLELLSMEAVFEGFPVDWKDD